MFEIDYKNLVNSLIAGFLIGLVAYLLFIFLFITPICLAIGAVFFVLFSAWFYRNDLKVIWMRTFIVLGVEFFSLIVILIISFNVNEKTMIELSQAIYLSLVSIIFGVLFLGAGMFLMKRIYME